MSELLLRARVPLFVPGDQPSRFPKAVASGADAIILDLEDAVAPDAKDAARAAVVAHEITTLPVVIRINPAGTAFHAGDLAALRGARLDAVMLAKCESGEAVDHTAAYFPDDVVIMPLIETALGLLHLPEILARPRVLRVAFGAYDFSLDIGCRAQWEPLAAARGELVWRSRAADRAAPWDSPSAEIRALDSVQREAGLAAAFGFGGKMAIHPAQLAVIAAAFRPDAADIAWAQEVVATAGQPGVAKVGGAMVDAPVLARARRILQDE